MDDDRRLSFNTRKSLCVHLNERAGAELAEVIEFLLDRIEQLERSKVDVTPIAPSSSRTLLEVRRAA
jgi:hypothetical protein